MVQEYNSEPDFCGIGKAKKLGYLTSRYVNTVIYVSFLKSSISVVRFRHYCKQTLITYLLSLVFVTFFSLLSYQIHYEIIEAV